MGVTGRSVGARGIEAKCHAERGIHDDSNAAAPRGRRRDAVGERGGAEPVRSVKNLSIPAEPLANALNDLAQQSGLQVMFASELVARLKSPEVKGSLTATEALQRLLTNTGLRYEFVNPHTITIVGPESKPTAPPAETMRHPRGAKALRSPRP